MGLARRRTRADLNGRSRGGGVAGTSLGSYKGMDVADHEPHAGSGRIPEWDSTNCDLRAAVHAFERRHISAVLTSVAGNKTKAARMLGIGLSSLYRKLEELGLAQEESSPVQANCEECGQMARDE